MERAILDVSQLNRYVKALFAENSLLNGLMVRGEISNFTRHYKSGHLYFTLKDAEASVKTVMFRGNAQYLKFQPENGMSVIISGAVSLYERDGSYQFYASDMQPDGIGALHLAYEQIKARLEKEGLFDLSRKRPLPPYPEAIGIVTSEGAAALQDMLHILARRYPLARVILYPALVQGEGAAKTIADGIRRMNEARACDVLIIGRGGGSMEDLWAFNDETLARVIASSAIPIISAVGHETDFTIADFAADLRAPTPSAAAELAVPNADDLLIYLDDLSRRCTGAIQRDILQYSRHLESLRAAIKTPKGVLEACSQKIQWLQHEMKGCLERRLEERSGRLRHAAALIEAVSPIRLLERGYSLTSISGNTVVSIQQTDVGDSMETRLADGLVYSTVTGMRCKPSKESVRKVKNTNIDRNEKGQRHGKTDDSGRSGSPD